MQTIPLTVLVYEGPIARAYLAHLKQQKLKPEKIILMVQKRDPANKKLIAKWLPESIRKKYAEKLQDLRMNFWSRKLTQHYPKVVDTMCKKVAQETGISESTIAMVSEPANYQQYSDQTVRVFVDGFKDPNLFALLEQLPETCVLYTGGGIVPEKILSIPHLKFMHVHPGHLPYVKGADGILWSTLIRGLPSATCFYQNAGIDTGDIIESRQFSAISFALPKPRLDIQTLYRLIYCFYDPFIRAALLASIIKSYSSYINIATSPQDSTAGLTYHFMNDDLKKFVMQKIFEFF